MTQKIKIKSHIIVKSLYSESKMFTVYQYGVLNTF
jgi:hypothetical protein